MPGFSQASSTQYATVGLTANPIGARMLAGTEIRAASYMDLPHSGLGVQVYGGCSGRVWGLGLGIGRFSSFGLVIQDLGSLAWPHVR